MATLRACARSIGTAKPRPKRKEKVATALPATSMPMPLKTTASMENRTSSSRTPGNRNMIPLNQSQTLAMTTPSSAMPRSTSSVTMRSLAVTGPSGVLPMAAAVSSVVIASSPVTRAGA
jgi:hypothetical protein